MDTVTSPKDASYRMSATVRRILPYLRQYSSWLVSNVLHLVALETQKCVGIQVTKFWRIYADALTLLAATFQRLDLPNVEYLLEEDEDTIAFTPFSKSTTSGRYLQGDGLTPRPRSRDQGVQRHHPNVEMLFRVKGLLEDGITLAVNKVWYIPFWPLKRETKLNETSVPLEFLNGSCFEFRDKGIPPEPSYSESHAQCHSSASINRDDIERAKKKIKLLRSSTYKPEDASESSARSGSVSPAMHRMVESLVGSKVSDNHEPSLQYSLGDFPPNRTTHNFGDDSTGPPKEKHQTIHPSLPSIWNSPFAPQPGEADSLHSRPSTAHKYPVPTTTTNVSPSNAPSSNTRFQEALLRQQQELEMQPSSLDDFPTTSPSKSTSSPARFLGRDITPTPSPFASSPSDPSAAFPSYDVPRRVQQQSRFGAIGQMPPSGQGG